jgi:polysaccharide export outer membrane protein
MWERASVVAAIWLLALGLRGGGAAEVEPPASGYRLGPRDLLAVKVFEVPELNVEVRVSERGTLNLPLIGEVAAEGLTVPELEVRLKTFLESRYVNRATVSVELREVRSRPIVVLGAVRNPGNLAFPGRWTLLEALAAAGGVTDNHGGVVTILRRASNGLVDQVEVSLDELFVRANPAVNLPILANDLINVPLAAEVSVFVLGAFGSPGELRFRSRERITVLSVVARAGGLTDRASKKILLKRRRGDTLVEERVLDYRRILAGKDPDIPLRAGDVLIARESFF